MTDTTIRNPGNDRHYARIRSLRANVRISRHGEMLADTVNALRMVEHGRDIYDPVIYVPRADVTGRLSVIDGKVTHCPLKGDCSYLAVDGEEVAWTYGRTLPGAAVIADHIAFYADKVTIEERGQGDS